MPLTRVLNHNITDSDVTEIKFTEGLIGFNDPKITTVNISNDTFTVLDDLAVNIGGGYIVVTGENFANGATVLIDTTPASSVSRINNTTLQVQVPPKSAATYNLYVVNPDGGTGIRFSAITYSGIPTWVTASPLTTLVSGNNIATFSQVLSATGANTYSVAVGSNLPTGTSLLANGYFYGTTEILSNTSYFFDIVATDTENQDSIKSFQQPVTYTMQRALYTLSPGEVPTLYEYAGANNWSKIDSTNYSTGAVKTDGTLWTWGPNNDGQLGLNDRVNRSSPVQVGTATDWKNVFSATSGQMFFQKNTNVFWSSGNNGVGQLGVNDRTDRSAPVQIGTYATVTAGQNLAIFTRNTPPAYMYATGYSNFGSAGANDSSWGRSRPTQVGLSTEDQWTDIKLGVQYFALGIDQYGNLMSWGNSANGQGGRNNRILLSSPVQVGALNNWYKLACGDSHVLSIKTDGTLWSWGNNDEGQLGHNNTILRSSPVQIGTDSDWSKISTRYSYNIAQKTNGTLWEWGFTRSSPVQIGTDTNWVEFAASATSGFAIKSY